MIALWSQDYYVPGLPKDFRIISPQVIFTSEGYKGDSAAHFHDEQDGYAELNLKENKPVWQKAEHVERIYLKYDPKNNFPTHEATLPNQREKDAKAMKNDVCVTNEANQKLTPSQKELILWHFRLGHIGFQPVKWSILTEIRIPIDRKSVVYPDFR